MSARHDNAPDPADGFLEKCRQAGVKGTHQRAEIYRELSQTRAHPDAKAIYERVRKRIPAISFDTVYRTLRLFEGLGFVSRVGIPAESARFDANTQPHAHFVCRVCGFIGDVFFKELDSVAVPSEIEGVGEVHAVYCGAVGVCRDCLAKRKSQ